MKITREKIELVDNLLCFAEFERNSIPNGTGNCYKKNKMIVNVFHTGSINFQGIVDENIKSQIEGLLENC